VPDIGLITNTSGGVYTSTRNLAKYLSKRGFTFHIYYLSQLDASNLLDFLKKNVDLIHTNYSSTLPILLCKRLKRRIPIVYTVRGKPQPWLAPSLFLRAGYSVENIFLHLSRKYIDLHISVSNFVKQQLLKKYGINSIVIYNGIDLSSVRPRKKDKAKIELGFSEEDLLILFVGKLRPVKDPITLIKAFYLTLNSFKSKKKHLHLLIAGDGELKNVIASIIKRLKIEENVHLFGWISKEKLAVLYSAADIFVLPSISEACPNAILEALAYGKSIISANNGGGSELIGNAGLVFKPQDFRELHKKITSLINNYELLHRLAQLAKRRAKLFSVKLMAKKYERVYKKLLEDNKV